MVEKKWKSPECAGRRIAALLLAMMIGLGLLVMTGQEPVFAAGETGTLVWSRQFGDPSTYNNGPTPPLIAGEKLYTASGTTLNEMNLSDGTTQRTLALDASTCYAMNAPAYDSTNDTIYVSLGTMNGWSVSDGMVEAVSRGSMTKKWTFSVPDQGQIATDVTTDGNRVYAATWGTANGGTYYAVSASDGSLVWSVSDPAGFYNSKAYILNGIVYFCSDQDSSGNSRLYVVNAADGTNAEDPIVIPDKVRSPIVGDGSHLYFVSCDYDAGGSLYRYDIAADGTLSNLKKTSLSGVATNLTLADGRVYVGTSASAIDVIDAESMTLTASASGLPGYPQAAPFVRTNADGTVTIYATYNNTPGGIYRIQLSGSTILSASDFYTPEADAQNYCLSPIVESNGILYYKNDSFRIFAVKEETEETTDEPYIITEGNHQTWTKGSGKDLSMTCSGPFDRFDAILIDGAELDAENYSVRSGSTVLTLNGSYLETLSTGKHTVTFRYTDGKSADGDFTIAEAASQSAGANGGTKAQGKTVKSGKSPKTGDTENAAGYGMLLAGAAILIAAALKASARSDGRR